MSPLSQREPGTLERVSRVYDRYARVYDVLFGWVLQDGRKRLARILKAERGERLLEIGVGSGLTLQAYPRDISVVGIDVSERMLAAAERKRRAQGLAHIELRLMDAERMSFASASFDHVVIAYAYSVTPDPHGLIREARRVCKAGGDIYIINHFSGLGFWRCLEAPLRPFADFLGFRPHFPFQAFVTDMNWDIVDVHTVNVLGLSRLVHFSNTPFPRGEALPTP